MLVLLLDLRLIPSPRRLHHGLKTLKSFPLINYKFISVSLGEVARPNPVIAILKGHLVQDA